MTAAGENVTVLFTDMVDSTRLSSELSVEAADELRQRHFSLLRQSVAASGGVEVKNLGDGMMVVFSAASSALECAVAMQQGVERENRTSLTPVGLRIGVSCGEATREDDDYFGDPVVEASRLCARAAGGQVLVSDLVKGMAGRRSTYPLEQIGALELKGLPEAVETYEIRWEPLGSDADELDGVPLPARLVHRPSVGVIGRSEELAVLDEAAKSAETGQGCRTVLISGEPGQGKTTLVAEAARRAHERGGWCFSVAATRTSGLRTSLSASCSATSSRTHPRVPCDGTSSLSEASSNASSQSFANAFRICRSRRRPILRPSATCSTELPLACWKKRVAQVLSW